MKKTLFLLLTLCLFGLCSTQMVAQEDVEFKMKLGDTIVWKPFTYCNMLSYNISGPKVISFKPVHFGEKIEIIAKQEGSCTVIAICNDDNTKTDAKIIVEKPYVAPIVEKLEKPETLPFTANRHRPGQPLQGNLRKGGRQRGLQRRTRRRALLEHQDRQKLVLPSRCTRLDRRRRLGV